MAEIFDLVDQDDNVIGTATRDECHKNNLRHRAVHILVFNPKGELFIQKRSKTKDVFPGLLEGSASGHVSSGETYEEAAVRELEEELGIKDHKLNEVAKFQMKVGKEHEIVKVLMLRCDCAAKVSSEEAEEGKFMPYKEVRQMIKAEPDKFSPCFRIAIDKYEESLM